MPEKTHFGFLIPLGAWVTANLTTINALLQGVLLVVGIVGGVPAAIVAIRKFNKWRKE